MNTYRIYEELSETLGEKAAKAVVHAIDNVYDELKSAVSKSDFSELKQVVLDLGQAQERTEKRVEELTKAQQDLTRAQERTEKRVEELTKTQQDLARAQEKTEKVVTRLVGEMREVKEQLGGLTHTVGYQLEDQAFKALPALLKRDFGIEVKGPLKRGYLPDRKSAGKFIEVNILGEGKRNGEAIKLVGEAKAQLSIKKATQYLDKVVPRIDTGKTPPFAVLVTYMESEPGVADYVRGRDAACYFTFEF